MDAVVHNSLRARKCRHAGTTVPTRGINLEPLTATASRFDMACLGTHLTRLSWSMSSIRSLLSPSQGSSISAQRSALADPSRRNVGFSSPHAPHEFWSEAATIIMFKVENVPERLWSPSGMCNQAECMGSKRRDASGELIPNSGAQCSMTRRLDSFVGSAY
jgi:hypothetical protein